MSKPGSFTDIAFDSGRIYERVNIIRMLEEEIETCIRTIKGLPCEECNGLKVAISLIMESK